MVPSECLPSRIDRLSQLRPSLPGERGILSKCGTAGLEVYLKGLRGSSARLRKIRARICIPAASLLVLLVVGMAQADEDSSGKVAGDRKEVPRFLIELKREATKINKG